MGVRAADREGDDLQWRTSERPEPITLEESATGGPVAQNGIDGDDGAEVPVTLLNGCLGPH